MHLADIDDRRNDGAAEGRSGHPAPTRPDPGTAVSPVRVPAVPDKAFTELELMRRALAMLAGRVDGPHAEFVEGLRAEVTRIEGVCATLRRYSELEAPLAANERRPIELHAIAESVLADVRRASIRGGVRLVYRAEPEEAWIRADGDAVAEALRALVGNALQFSDSGPVIVTVTADEGRAALAVEDSGPGMSPEDLARLVQPFRQGDSRDDRLHGGLGLGLTIADAVARRYDGRLDVDRLDRRGSRLTLRFDRWIHTEHVPLRRVA